MQTGIVTAVGASREHGLAKRSCPRIRLLAGLGVEGDAHAGALVQHRSRAARFPDRRNDRQVHLIHAELHDELRAHGLVIEPCAMGENITTRGIDLLALPVGTLLHVGATAVLELTGLRNPCAQLDELQPGLMAATLERRDDGALIRKAGVMSTVRAGGEITAGDPIAVDLPPEPHTALEPV